LERGSKNSKSIYDDICISFYLLFILWSTLLLLRSLSSEEWQEGLISSRTFFNWFHAGKPEPNQTISKIIPKGPINLRN
jgi:hypothetical protein